MYNNDLAQFSQDFSSFTFTDDETLAAMKTIYAANGYIEPHGLWDILD
jgi:threonine synthase